MSNTSHPKGLYTLFMTEMWERFSYYGMRAILVLYLTAKVATDGFGLERQEALELYAIFTGLVYLTPILGGWISDKFFGKRKTVYIGGFVMAIGQFLLAASAFMAQSLDIESRLFLFNFGLGTLIIGNGFFKPNISTIVGDFYDDNDPRKDSAFNIFYMGINLGAFLGPFLAGTLAENVHWGWGYFAAGVGLLVSVVWLYFQEESLLNHGMPPGDKDSKEGSIGRLGGKDWKDIILSVIGLTIGTLVLMKVWGMLPDTVAGYIAKLGFAAGIIGLAQVIIKGINGDNDWQKPLTIVAAVVVVFLIGNELSYLLPAIVMKAMPWVLAAGLIGGLIVMMRNDNSDWSRMGVIMTLAVFNIAFWAGFEQAGGTMNLFAVDSTNRLVGGFEIPATWFQNINPFAILIFAPIFSIMWIKLSQKKMNPRTPIKFALGLFLGAIAFWIMNMAVGQAEGGNMVSPMWLFVVYVVLTLGELMLSPIGLSMITKLAPTKLVSVVMGLWMASFAAGNYIAGMLEHILASSGLPLYPFIAGLMLVCGILLVLLSPILNKAMKGIH